MHSIAAGFVQLDEPIDDLLRRADEVDVAAYNPLIASILLPGGLVPPSESLVEVIGRYRILMSEDRVVLGTRSLLFHDRSHAD